MKVSTFQSLQEDVNDIEGLIISCQKKNAPKDILKKQKDAILSNLKEHLNELIEK